MVDDAANAAGVVIYGGMSNAPEDVCLPGLFVLPTKQEAVLMMAMVVVAGAWWAVCVLVLAVAVTVIGSSGSTGHWIGSGGLSRSGELLIRSVLAAFEGSVVVVRRQVALVALIGTATFSHLVENDGSGHSGHTLAVGPAIPSGSAAPSALVERARVVLSSPLSVIRPLNRASDTNGVGSVQRTEPGLKWGRRGSGD